MSNNDDGRWTVDYAVVPDSLAAGTGGKDGQASRCLGRAYVPEANCCEERLWEERLRAKRVILLSRVVSRVVHRAFASSAQPMTRASGRLRHVEASVTRMNGAEECFSSACR